MANTFITTKAIAREGLPILADNLVAPMLMHQDHSKEFAQQGNQVQVKRPNIFVADDFATGGSISIQDLNQFPVIITLDKIADVSVEITTRDLSLKMPDFIREVLDPAVVAIAEKINSAGLGLAKDIPYAVGTSGTTPATLGAMADAMLTLDVNKVPQNDRRAVWDPYANAELLQLDSLVEKDKAGTSDALRMAAMGNVYKFENYMSQGVETHTAGLYSALADVTGSITAANNAVDALTGYTYSVATLESAAGASTATLLKGDLLTLDGVQHVVYEDTAAAIAGDIASVKLYPPVTANVAAKAVVFADVTAKAHTSNLAFHRQAFAFVNRPLAPMAGLDSYSMTASGLSLRVTLGSAISTKKTTLSIDCLYDYATLYPELACQVLG